MFRMGRKRQLASAADMRILKDTLDYTLESHNRDMNAAIAQGDDYWAGWYARQAVSFYLLFCATTIAQKKRQTIRTAYEIARREIYSVSTFPELEDSGKNSIGDEGRC